jgi:hypothetical protein
MILCRKRGRNSLERVVKVHGDLDLRHWRMKKLLPWRYYMDDDRCGGRGMSAAYPGTRSLCCQCGCSFSRLLVAFGIPSSSYKMLLGHREMRSAGYKVSYMIEYRSSLAVPVPALRAGAKLDGWCIWSSRYRQAEQELNPVEPIIRGCSRAYIIIYPRVHLHGLSSTFHPNFTFLTTTNR